jgi:hypothetical protein
VVAAYFGEQMGRNTLLVATDGCDGSVSALEAKEAPMAVVNCNWSEPPDGMAFKGPALALAGIKLVMAGHAVGDLNFSLVGKYMEKLATISGGEWEAAMARVEKGEGVRKVALDLLRERDLL